MFGNRNSLEKNKINFFWLKLFFGYFLIIVIIAGFASGFYYGKIEAEKRVNAQARVAFEEFTSGKVDNKKSVPKFLTNDINFNLYWDVWQRVRDNYVDKPVSETKMLYGSLEGMVASVGDPYTMFFDPEIALKFQQELEGSFEGIGAEIGIRKGRLTIIAPLPDTPAEKSGLRPGDQIFYIDNVQSSTISLEEAVTMIRGLKGTVVTLKVWRENNGEELIEIPVTRDKISVVSVTWKKIENELTTNNNIAYIKIRHFDENSDIMMSKIAPEILKSKPDSIVLDLRNNPGGFLDRSINIAGEWINNQVVVKEKDRNNKINEYTSGDKALFKGIKTVVLINNGSASASEIVAGALQDYGLATIIGETSFGKGSVQDYQSLKDGSALKITIAKWMTPKGRSIDGNGIVPDIEIKMTDTDYEEDKDPQFDRAIEFIVKGK